MTGFEPQTSGIGSDRSINWATTTSQNCLVFIIGGHCVNFYEIAWAAKFLFCESLERRKLTKNVAKGQKLAWAKND